jgi:hypothetical protein
LLESTTPGASKKFVLFLQESITPWEREKKSLVIFAAINNTWASKKCVLLLQESTRPQASKNLFYVCRNQQHLKQGKKSVLCLQESTRPQAR